jgi:hypothetical protein
MPRRSPSGDELSVVDRAPGRWAGEERITFAGPQGFAARGIWFAGRPGLRPWADLVVADLRMLPAVAQRLGPGGALMVAYGADETERALRRRVPPAATPLGLALLAAGCRWFKDWSFAEGGREGSTKLQGNLPTDAAHARMATDALARELRAFLDTGTRAPADRDRAETALGVLDP